MVSQTRQGFTVVEILIASALLLVISLGVSRLLQSTDRSVQLSSLSVGQRNLERYLTSILHSEAARCNSLRAGGNIGDCVVECLDCLDGTCASAGADCRNSALCTSGGDPQVLSFREFQSTADSRFGGSDGQLGNTITGLGASGNKITDSGIPCDGTYQAASSLCRWNLLVEYQPDGNDLMRYFFQLSYQANEQDDPHKTVPERSWNAVIPMEAVCTTYP